MRGALPFLLFFVACGGHPTKTIAPAPSASAPPPPPIVVDTEPFRLKCTRNTECIAVASTVCKPCACVDTAISSSQRATFAAVYQAMSARCPPVGEVVDCEACAPMTPVCDRVTHTCSLQ